MVLTGIRALQLALAALCLYLTYAAVWPAFQTASAFDLPPPPAAAVRETIDPSRYKLISERNVFGGLVEAAPVEAAPVVEDIAESKLPAKLIGTLVSANPKLSLATVLDTRARVTLHVRIGEKLLDADVEGIERKRVIVRNKGRREEIVFDEESTPKGAAVPRATKTPRRARPARASNRRTTDRLQRIAEAKKRLETRKAREQRGLMHQAKITPKFTDDGQFAGITLNDVKADGPLAGLPDGTICHSVNGAAIGGIQDLAPLLQSVDGQFTITCTPPGGSPEDRTL